MRLCNVVEQQRGDVPALSRVLLQWNERQGRAEGRVMEVTIFSDTRGRQGVTLLVIRPHPDDESIATGGTLASDNRSYQSLKVPPFHLSSPLLRVIERLEC